MVEVVEVVDVEVVEVVDVDVVGLPRAVTGPTEDENCVASPLALVAVTPTEMVRPSSSGWTK